MRLITAISKTDNSKEIAKNFQLSTKEKKRRDKSETGENNVQQWNELNRKS